MIPSWKEEINTNILAKKLSKISTFGQVREILAWASGAGGILGHAGAAAANGVWQNFFVHFETSHECLLLCQRASSKVHFWPFYSRWVDSTPTQYQAAPVKPNINRVKEYRNTPIRTVVAWQGGHGHFRWRGCQTSQTEKNATQFWNSSSLSMFSFRSADS